MGIHTPCLCCYMWILHFCLLHWLPGLCEVMEALMPASGIGNDLLSGGVEGHICTGNQSRHDTCQRVHHYPSFIGSPIDTLVSLLEIDLYLYKCRTRRKFTERTGIEKENERLIRKRERACRLSFIQWVVVTNRTSEQSRYSWSDDL